jgi:hypothetical protein
MTDKADKKASHEPWPAYIITGSYKAPQLSPKEAAAFYRPPEELRNRLILA